MHGTKNISYYDVLFLLLLLLLLLVLLNMSIKYWDLIWMPIDICFETFIIILSDQLRQ